MENFVEEAINCFMPCKFNKLKVQERAISFSRNKSLFKITEMS